MRSPGLNSVPDTSYLCDLEEAGILALNLSFVICKMGRTRVLP